MKEGLAATKQHPLPRTIALRMSSAVKCSEAGHDICKACFELPQAPYASDLWPAHDPMLMSRHGETRFHTVFVNYVYPGFQL